MTKRREIHVIGRLRGAEPVGYSVNGNPRWRLIIESNGMFRTYLTKRDASCSYGITNPEFMGQMCDFELTETHRVRYVTPIKIGG